MQVKCCAQADMRVVWVVGYRRIRGSIKVRSRGWADNGVFGGVPTKIIKLDVRTSDLIKPAGGDRRAIRIRLVAEDVAFDSTAGSDRASLLSGIDMELQP